MQHYHVLIYDIKTGNPVHWTERVSEDDVASHANPERGWGAIACEELPIKQVEIPIGDQTYSVVQVDTEAVKRSSMARIDRGVAAELARHITPGMDATYSEKLVEARSHRKRAATPLLAAEAAARRCSIADVAESVIARAESCLSIRHRLEVARQNAKAIVRDADNLIDIVEAETTDWAAIAAEQGE